MQTRALVPNIPLPPPRWRRLVKFRRCQEHKLADVYYIPPSSKLHFRVKVVRSSFLKKNRKEVAEQSLFSYKMLSKGLRVVFTNLLQFCHKFPKGPRGKSTRKRVEHVAPLNDDA